MFYIFLQFYLTSLRGKDYFAKEPEPVGARCFWPLGDKAGAAGKKIPGAGAAWEKNQEPEPLEKKSGAGAAKKFAGSPAQFFSVKVSQPDPGTGMIGHPLIKIKKVLAMKNFIKERITKSISTLPGILSFMKFFVAQIFFTFIRG